MAGDAATDVSLERIRERLRQDRETFNQHKAHEDKWFMLRLVMGYSAAALLVAFLIVSALVIFNADHFPSTIVGYAGAAFFVDSLGLVVSIWKVVFNPDFMTRLAPVIQLQEVESEALDRAQTVPAVKGQRLLILSAKYGVGDKWMDVAPLLRTLVREDRLRFTASNAELGGDPVPNFTKRLELVYTYDSRTYSKAYPENGEVEIPTP